MALIDVLDPKVTGPLLEKFTADEQQVVAGFLAQLQTVAHAEVTDVATQIEAPLLAQLEQFYKLFAELAAEVTNLRQILAGVIASGIKLSF